MCSSDAVLYKQSGLQREDHEGIGIDPLIERQSLCLNPCGSFFRNRTLRSIGVDDGNQEALAEFERSLETSHYLQPFMLFLTYSANVPVCCFCNNSSINANFAFGFAALIACHVRNTPSTPAKYTVASLFIFCRECPTA